MTEADILRDEQERSSLLKVIADVETAIAASTPGARRMLENTVENARKRVTTLDKRIEEAKVEHAAEVQTQVAAAAALAAKETKLSAKDRETYRGFIEEAYFTRKDFGRLDEFYTHSYDRLSEGGKDEMSHRVWEGVRRNEYRFDDLPEEVREKEAKRAYTKLSVRSRDSDANNIPESDREEFLQAYRSGDRKAISYALSRDSFKQNVSLQSPGGAAHQAAAVRRVSDDEKTLAAETPPVSVPPESSAMTKIKETAAALKDLTLADGATDPSTAALPNATRTNINRRSPA